MDARTASPSDNVLRDAIEEIRSLRDQLGKAEARRNEPIAIVGMACNFPGGRTPEAFFEFLLKGEEAISEFPDTRATLVGHYDPDPTVPGKTYTNRGGFIEDFDEFSPGFFGISPREAQYMDPQQRLLLETHWAALENSGIATESLATKQVGVFVGIGTTDYTDVQVRLGPTSIDAYNGTGGSHAAAAGRLSYLLGVRGPSLAVDTACSSSLVSVHLAVMSLRSGESDLALASGVNANFSSDVFISLCKARMLSPDGRCKSFDAKANGYVRGEGCGVVALKRLSDAQADGDHILGLVRGSAVNHNGRSSGLTVPSGPAQQEVIRSALKAGGIDPDEVFYVEAHGTGTAVGDPIEAAALGAVFEGRESPLLIGSVKTNTGHLEWAAGVCGLIKLVMSMRDGRIPASLHFEEPNPLIPWDRLPLKVVSGGANWPDGRRIGGVSSFGFGGTNAHVVVEAAPPSPRVAASVERSMHVITVSAKSEVAVRELAGLFADRLSGSVDFADAAFSANTGRTHYPVRLAVSAADAPQAVERLRAAAAGESPKGVRLGETPAGDRKIAMLFTGQGSQRPGMARELYDTAPVFRRALDRCAGILRDLLDRPLLDILYPTDGADEAIHDTGYTQPALFALEWSLAQLWRSWGVEPEVVLGHSVGEYVAACVAGVFSVEDGLRLVAARARLMQALPAGGAMLAVRASEEKVGVYIKEFADKVAVATINGLTDVTISGARAAIEVLAARLKADGIAVTPLKVSHAFHSPLMDPMLEDFALVAAGVTFNRPQISLISNVTGAESGGSIVTPAYWVRHVRQAVRFADGLACAAAMGCDVFVEAGPHPVLSALGRAAPGTDSAIFLPSLYGKQGDWQTVLDTLGALHVAGVPIDWAGFDAEYARRKTPLPATPFERQRFWFPAASGAGPGRSALRPLVETMTRSPLVKQTIVATPFSVAALPFLADHKVYDTVVAPGAAYLALLASGADLLGWDGARIEGVYFLAPLFLVDDEERIVQTVLTPDEADDTSQTVEIISLPPTASDGDMIRHATARLRPASPASGRRLDLAGLRADCPDALSADELFDIVATAGIDLGPQFRWIDEAWLGERQALARLRAPDAAGGLAGFWHHPALLDSCIQLAGATLSVDGTSETLLPFSIGAVNLHGPAGEGPWWCHAVRTGEASWDIALADASGAVIATFEQFEMRKAPSERFMRRRTNDWIYQLEWRQEPVPAADGALGAGSWLLLGESPFGEALAGALRERGQVVQQDPGATPDDVVRAVTAFAAADGPEPRGVIDARGLTSGSTNEPAERGEALTVGLIRLVQALQEAKISPALTIVTANGQAVHPAETLDPGQAALWGATRTLMMETPELRPACIDMAAQNATDRADDIAAELLSPSGDAQIVWRGAERLVARLARYRDARAARPDGPFRLQLAEFGSPDQLRLAPMARREPGPRQVEIEVKASALNFRDVLIALGMLKDYYTETLGYTCAADIPLGFDCAGVVTAVGEGVTRLKVGDEVMAPAAGGAASHVTWFDDVMVKKPVAATFEQAAAIPTVFWTAYHALRRLVDLKAGERVLIHAAAGGVGLAAVQIAQAAGAEVFATASPGKWDYLKSIGVRHVMNSRSLDFAGEIARLTGGGGVDVVLNSLSGAAIEKSFSVLAKGGRFVDIGKIGVWTQQEATERRPDAAYHTFDLGEVMARDPVMFNATLEELRALFDDGVLLPLPQAVFSVDDAVDAYRYMQQAKHIGKVVLTYSAEPAPGVRPDASYLITGGLGGLGLAVAGRLIDEGARNLVLAGRGAPSDAARDAIAALVERGARVEHVRADVAMRADVDRLVAACEALAPLKGVVHAAGVLRDATVRNQTPEGVGDVMAAKARGAWNLHQATLDTDLDHFIGFGSMAGLMGSPGQVNYAAANAILDAIVRVRRAEGRPGLAIDWGPWADVGMAADMKGGGHGVDKIEVRDGLDVFWSLLSAPKRSAPTQVGVMRVRWDAFAKLTAMTGAGRFISGLSRAGGGAAAAKDDVLDRYRAETEEGRPALLEAYIRRVLLEVLGLDAGYEIKPQTPWLDLGLDSLMMVEVKNRLDNAFRLTIPVDVLMADVTTASLVHFVADKLARSLDQAPVAHHGPDEQEIEDAIRLQMLERLQGIPQMFTIAEDQKDRRVLIDGKWRIDFASCNYLGFDLEPEIMAAIGPAVEKWGTHPSWTRAVASPALYQELERELAQTLGAPDTLAFPSISLLHNGVLPALAGYSGVIFKDMAAHHSIHDACQRARADGADWQEFRHNDVDDLVNKLTKHRLDRTKIIAIDGAFSMGDANPPLAEYVRIANLYNATIYVDDAHGFGILGERPDETMPYGYGGGGIVRHLGLDYAPDRIVYVAGLSKAFSSYAAFVTVHDPMLKLRLQASGPYVFSGPTCVASLATALAGLRLNRRDGDRRRAVIHGLARRLIVAAREIGFEVENANDFPVVGVVMGSMDAMPIACQILWEHDILITPATYPAVPMHRSLARFSITAANTDEEVDRAIAALKAVWSRLHTGEMMRAGAAELVV